ncbi:MAG: 50S ribosomal protein L10 [Candidatus Omnitrophica bacterium]|nr:50S ribosomal protein L10 [Candidatus Omnitrophota bacterium]
MEKVGQIFRKGLINGIKDGVNDNASTFLLSYSSLSASKMDGLRKELHRIGAHVSVSRNRIAKLAFEELDHGKLAENIDRQTAFVWSSADSVEVSKVLMKFAEECEGVSVQGGVLDGNVLMQADVKRLSDLPSKNVLRAQVLQMIISPLTRLASVLNAKTRDVLSILKQLGEQKEGGN